MNIYYCKFCRVRLNEAQVVAALANSSWSSDPLIKEL